MKQTSKSFIYDTFNYEVIDGYYFCYPVIIQRFILLIENKHLFLSTDGTLINVHSRKITQKLIDISIVQLQPKYWKKTTMF